MRDARYAEDELPREGLPCWSRDDFIATFLRRHRLKSADVEVTRIAFEYVDDEYDDEGATPPNGLANKD